MTLEALGYLRRTGNNRYILAPSTLALGTAYLSSHGIREALNPVLRGLRDRSGLSSSVAVLDGNQITYVARAPATGPLRIQIDVGQRLPAYATAMGRVLLAALPEVEFEAWLGRTTLKPLTNLTITDPDRFRQAIEVVRKQGFSLIDGELASTIKVLAVPIISSNGRTVAALNVTTQSGLEREDDVVATFLPELRRAALEISTVWHHLDLQTSEAILGSRD